MVQAVRGLAYLRSRNVVHGDLSSNNFLVTIENRTRVTKILDLGFAGVFRPEGGDGVSGAGDGQFVGKFAFASPEHFFPSDIDWRSDVYSLGVVFHRLLTGEAPITVSRESRYFDWMVAHEKERAFEVPSPRRGPSLAGGPSRRGPSDAGPVPRRSPAELRGDPRGARPGQAGPSVFRRARLAQPGDSSPARGRADGVLRKREDVAESGDSFARRPFLSGGRGLGTSSFRRSLAAEEVAGPRSARVAYGALRLLLRFSVTRDSRRSLAAAREGPLRAFEDASTPFETDAGRRGVLLDGAPLVAGPAGGREDRSDRRAREVGERLGRLPVDCGRGEGLAAARAGAHLARSLRREDRTSRRRHREAQAAVFPGAPPSFDDGAAESGARPSGASLPFRGDADLPSPPAPACTPAPSPAAARTPARAGGRRRSHGRASRQKRFEAGPAARRLRGSPTGRPRTAPVVRASAPAPSAPAAQRGRSSARQDRDRIDHRRHRRPLRRRPLVPDRGRARLLRRRAPPEHAVAPRDVRRRGGARIQPLQARVKEPP